MTYAKDSLPGFDLNRAALLTARRGEVFMLTADQVDDEFFLSLDSAALADRTIDFSLEEAEAWHIRWGNILDEARRQRDAHRALEVAIINSEKVSGATAHIMTPRPDPSELV